MRDIDLSPVEAHRRRGLGLLAVVAVAVAFGVAGANWNSIFGGHESEASRAKATAAAWFVTNVPGEAALTPIRCLRLSSPDEFNCSAKVTVGSNSLFQDLPIDLLVACDAAGGPCDARKLP